MANKLEIVEEILENKERFEEFLTAILVAMRLFGSGFHQNETYL